jgi:hypothetical protein
VIGRCAVQAVFVLVPAHSNGTLVCLIEVSAVLLRPG